MSNIVSKVTRQTRKIWILFKRKDNKENNSKYPRIGIWHRIFKSYYNCAQEHKGKYVHKKWEDEKSQQRNKNSVSENKNSVSGFN